MFFLAKLLNKILQIFLAERCISSRLNQNSIDGFIAEPTVADAMVADASLLNTFIHDFSKICIIILSCYEDLIQSYLRLSGTI